MGMVAELLEKISRVKVAVVGDVVLDAYVHGSVERISPEAPVPVLSAAREEYRPGGAANVAMNAGSLGAARVSLCGVCGADAEGAMLVEILAKGGCELRPQWLRSSARTITKRRFVAGRQQMLRVDYDDSPRAYAIDLKRDAQALARALVGADVVILSDYAKGTLTSEVVAAIQKVCEKQKSLLSVGLKPKNILEFKGADLVTLNRKEALELSGLQVSRGELFPSAEIFRRLHERYRAKHLVVTLGEEGMVAGADGRIVGKIPTFAREVYDVSGAGDTAIAALSCALAAGASLIGAVRLANLASGVVVGKAGTATASPMEIFAHEKLAELSEGGWQSRVEMPAAARVEMPQVVKKA